VGAGGAWFRLPDGTLVDLAKRRHLQKLLGALARHRLEAPDHALSIESLFTRGWPGERVIPKARASRVHVALTTLRNYGLRDLLQHRDDGYLLDPRVALRFD
jgi:hypothetical protein